MWPDYGSLYSPPYPQPPAYNGSYQVRAAAHAIAYFCYGDTVWQPAQFLLLLLRLLLTHEPLILLKSAHSVCGGGECNVRLSTKGHRYYLVPGRG